MITCMDVTLLSRFLEFVVEKKAKTARVKIMEVVTYTPKSPGLVEDAENAGIRLAMER